MLSTAPHRKVYKKAAALGVLPAPPSLSRWGVGLAATVGDPHPLPPLPLHGGRGGGGEGDPDVAVSHRPLGQSQWWAEQTRELSGAFCTPSCVQRY